MNSSSDSRPAPSDVPLPPGWSRPRELPEARPTLAPALLAFGLAGGTLGLLVSSRAVLVLGALVALLGAGLWAWAAYQETRGE
ncbi:hypothetical protein [Deinococcus gobiensis]|jgi:hypothetical protein|uniref:Uncharacterized protein n=1 Tax=Deinococcus gobiensis (strain DSM 21396 / JCM 16679 / CGMCC 1.7299 / I-0) TaxID=745776 RepID=H8H0V7_DEIGI|nr:hypothetical protein [Deinococcus gobiensis]AFD26976.1 hypothetical protein DGo_PA0090 [Deinococcus gobiensis I-0]